MADDQGFSKFLEERLRVAAEIERAQKRAADLEAAAASKDAQGAVEPEESSAESLAAVKLRQRQQRIALRKKLADYAIWIVIVQLGLANLFFGFYLYMNAVNPEPTVMVAWLSATVVEVIGILWVIARSLFPFQDKSLRSDRAATK